jgi:acetyl esterase/lipase
MFRDQDLAYALRLGQAGVPVEFHLHPGARPNSTSSPSTPPPSTVMGNPAYELLIPDGAGRDEY